MSDDEKANMALMSQNFKEILNDPGKIDIVENVMQLKGETFFSIIKWKAGDEVFDDFLDDFIYRHKFKVVDVVDFIGEIKDKFDINILPYMDEWYNSKKLPAFLFGTVNAVKVLDKDEQKTMIKFKVTNVSKEEGVFTIDFRTGGGNRRMGGFSETISKLVYLEGNQTKEISFLIDGTPRGITLNTLASMNIPNEIRLSLDNVPEDDKAMPYEGEKIVDDPVSLTERNEIIVDNEDPGFSVTKGNSRTSLLREILFSEEEETSKYSGFNTWRSPTEWRLTTNSDFYGASIRSAYYIRSGEGDKKAQWKIPIKKVGYYDVYVYIYKEDNHRHRSNNNKGGYHYIVYSDNGKEEITLELKTADKGWNLLGSYYFSSDSAVVELTNQSESRTIVADAVKLTEQK